MRAVLVDAGPLVALLDADDNRHEWAVARTKSITAPMTTVWSAVTEACFLLMSRTAHEPQLLLEAISNRDIEIAEMGRPDLPFLIHLMRQYGDLPMDLADAALVHAYHRDGFDAVMTLDVRDFSVYRVAGKPLRLITPND